MSIIYILIGLTLLVIGGEYLVRAAVGLSFKLKLSKMVIGLTVVSFATSLPELIVSLQAALKGFSDIALGNVIGSNIANIGLVLGITAIISPIVVDRDFYKYNWPVMMLFSLALYLFLWNDGILSRTEGIGFLIAMVFYLFFLIRQSKRKSRVEVDEVVTDDTLKGISYVKIFIWLIIGGAALWGGSELLVKGAVDLATTMGVSERVIAVTMIAVGTSVPELAASVIAALKKEKAISFGNLIGSNVFNIGSVLGVTAIIQPIMVQSQEVLTNDILWMLGFAVMLIPLAFLPQKLIFNRSKGLVIFISYLVFTGLAFFG